MILTAFAVNTNHHLWISHVSTSQQFGIRTDIVCMKCRVFPTPQCLKMSQSFGPKLSDSKAFA